MVFLHITSQLFIMWPYYRKTPSFTARQLIGVLLVHNLLVLYMYVAYWYCLSSDAGGVPMSWHPPDGSYKRYCYQCRAFKPPRAHHCRVCRRCVLRMDHHCPWIGNCVGHGTYAHFLRYTTAVTLASWNHLLMITLRVVDFWSVYDWMVSHGNLLSRAPLRPRP